MLSLKNMEDPSGGFSPTLHLEVHSWERNSLKEWIGPDTRHVLCKRIHLFSKGPWYLLTSRRQLLYWLNLSLLAQQTLDIRLGSAEKEVEERIKKTEFDLGNLSKMKDLSRTYSARNQMTWQSFLAIYRGMQVSFSSLSCFMRGGSVPLYIAVREDRWSKKDLTRFLIAAFEEVKNCVELTSCYHLLNFDSTGPSWLVEKSSTFQPAAQKN